MKRFFRVLICLSAFLLRGAEPLPTAPAEFNAAFDRLRASKNVAKASDRLQELFRLQWHYSMLENPEWATYTGYPGQNHRWTDLSAGALERRRRETTRPKAVLESIDRSQLNENDQLSYDLFLRGIRLDEEGLRFPGELLAITQLDGVQRTLPDTLAQMPTGKASEIEDILKRLEGADVLIRQTIELLRKGVAKGVVPPRVPLRDVPQQVLNLKPADPSQSGLYQPLTRLPTSLSESDQASVRARALGIITNRIYPALGELHGYLVEDYLPKCRDTFACAALPDGKDWYAYNARVRTTTSLTPREIHEIGQREVRRIRGEMQKILEKTGFKGTFAEFLVYLRTDPKFFYERGTELIAGYRDITKRADGELPKLFGRLPRTPYTVQPVPSYSEKSQTAAYYQPGAMTQGRPGIYFANTYSIGSRPKWEMEALSLHESVPGHHLQIALAQELEGVPDFRKNAETTAFVEGWGLYSESLGESMGFYQDPYSKFGQLTYEMWRAIRLVVDTGIHELGWSRDEAIAFFKENAGKSEHDIIVEVDRYIVWPGQALAYKIGELKLQELRRMAERDLGDKFDIRSFHDEIHARGALPLEVLEGYIRQWIQRQKSKG